MRVMVLGNVFIGDSQGLLMQPEVLRRWQLDKAAAVNDAIEQGVRDGVGLCVVAGGLFHDGFVPDSLLRAGIDALANHNVPIAYMAKPKEALGAWASVELPEGITLYQNSGLEVERCLSVSVSQDGQSTVSFNKDGAEKTVPVRPLEPTSFDAMRTGFVVFDIENGEVSSVHESLCVKHPFVTKQVHLDHLENEREMGSAISASIADVDGESCLRLVLEGPVPPLSYVNQRKIADALKNRFFYLEVLDETTVDVSEDELVGDVSLSAEFIRVVNSDDSLSPDEKTRIIRCGLNALNGRELVE